MCYVLSSDQRQFWGPNREWIWDFIYSTPQLDVKEKLNCNYLVLQNKSLSPFYPDFYLKIFLLCIYHTEMHHTMQLYSKICFMIASHWRFAPCCETSRVTQMLSVKASTFRSVDWDPTNIKAKASRSGGFQKEQWACFVGWNLQHNGTT